jgi:hypothetical protein
MVEAPGVGFGQQGSHESARNRAFPVKLLIRGTFDVSVNFPGFSSVTPESTYFLETLWRRREPVPEAKATGRQPGASKEAEGFVEGVQILEKQARKRSEPRSRAGRRDARHRVAAK